MAKNKLGSITDMGGGKYRLRISITDDYGKRHQPSKVVHASGKREANRMLADFYNECTSGTYSAGKHLTLSDLYNEWMKNHCEKTLNNGTINNYRSYWERFLFDKGNIKLDKIKPSHIYDILSGSGMKENSRTQKALFDMLKTMLGRAVKWGYMSSNPCSYIDTPNYKAKEKKPLTEANIAAVMEALPNEEAKYRAMFILAAVLGMRRQEIVALKWSDIDFKNKIIRICRAAEPVKGKGTSIKETWWRKFSEKLGIEGVTFHGLRHTAASFMIMNNVPITTVSSVLGHADVTTTLKIYSHVIEDTKSAAIKSMEQIILNNNAKD